MKRVLVLLASALVILSTDVRALGQENVAGSVVAKCVRTDEAIRATRTTDL
jgi:hypothetical protein